MDRQKLLPPLLLLCVILFLSGCSPQLLPPDTGSVIQKTFAVESFGAVNICCGMQLAFTQGPMPSVAIEGDAAILNEIELFVREDELIVQLQPRFALPRLNLLPRLHNRLVTLYITTPDLYAVTLSGGSEGEIGLLQAVDLNVTLSGGSQLVIDELDADTLTSDLSGGAQLAIVTGALDLQLADASGSSRYFLEEVQSERAELDLSGGSQARIRVDTLLRADASGGSDIAYHGRPALDQTISGGSRVRSLGD